MKKILFMLISATLMTLISSCTKDEPVLPNADKERTDVKINGDSSSDMFTRVTIYSAVHSGYGDTYNYLDSVQIFSAENELVGAGLYLGDYLVPYYGSISLTYHNYAGYYYHSSFNVGTMKRMYIAVDNGEATITDGITYGSKGDYIYLN